MQSGAAKTRLGRNHPCLGAVLAPLDLMLRKLQSIEEYTDAPGCIFRIRLVSNAAQIRFADGTTLVDGVPLIDVHLWNERVPAMPPEGATLAWARQMDDCMAISLRELAHALATRRDLDGVQGIRASMSLAGAERFDQIARVVGRYGFETFPEPRITKFRGRLHRLGENILVSLLILATNSAAFRLALLGRGRSVAYMSRGTLEGLYGSHRTGRLRPARRRFHLRARDDVTGRAIL